jgi:hypothetical protein
MRPRCAVYFARPVGVGDVIAGCRGTSAPSTRLRPTRSPRTSGGRGDRAHRPPPGHTSAHPRAATTPPWRVCWRSSKMYSPAAFRTSSVLSTRLRQPVHLARSATIDYCPPSASVTSPGSSTPLPPPFTSRLRWPSKFAPSLPLGRPRDRPRCCDASFTSRLRGRRGVLIVRLQESPWAIHPSATPRSRSRVRSPSPGTTPSPPFDPRGVLREHREARDPESKTEGKIKGGSHVWGK